MKKIHVLLIVLSMSLGCFAQSEPRLIVGIVVDQMRADYLDRFRPLFGSEGFERLRREGAEFRYAHFNYVPTYTGPGHASVFTGAPPFEHGIIGNNWYDPFLKKQVYCVGDERQTSIGCESDAGMHSPHRMRSGSLGDALKLHTFGKSKVYGLSIKDRSAILSAGHSADWAFWYDSESGDFVSSSYYQKASLPKWLEQFNKADRPRRMMRNSWNLLADRKAYAHLAPDQGPGERDVFQEGGVCFPHEFSSLSRSEKRSLIRWTPHGNTLLTDLAMELIENEFLGQDEFPDMLALSYSTPDHIGHAYGPNSWEVADQYARLDRDIARLLSFLDETIGDGKYTVFLTADHGVKPNGAVLKELNIPAGIVPSHEVARSTKDFLQEVFGDTALFERVFDNHIHLKLDSLQLPPEPLIRALRSHLLAKHPNIKQIYTRMDLEGFSAVRGMDHLVLNGMNPLRTGDLVFDLYPNYTTGGGHEVGTTHGSSFDYDTHVPLLFFGKGVPKMRSAEEVYILDIAPTISNLMGMMEPDGCIGKPLF